MNFLQFLDELTNYAIMTCNFGIKAQMPPDPPKKPDIKVHIPLHPPKKPKIEVRIRQPPRKPELGSPHSI
jgi:hypothetical protein